MAEQRQVVYGMLSREGEREVNEDAIGAAQAGGKHLFVLCDGLGGHGKGEVASSLVVSEMKAHFETNCQAGAAQCLEAGILQAQQALLERQEADGAPHAMKTTVCGLVLDLDGSMAVYGHVGDSRLYVFEKGKFKARTLDHSVPQMLASRGDIKESEIRHHEDRNRLLRVMGTPWDDPRYQISKPVALTKHSVFLLCSDGFWEWIEEKAMMDTLKHAASPQEWLEKMELLVLEAGSGKHMDNYSAIAVWIR